MEKSDTWLIAVIFQLFWLAFLLVCLYNEHYIDRMRSIDVKRLYTLPSQLSATTLHSKENDLSKWSQFFGTELKARFWWQNWTDDSLLGLVPISGTHHSCTYTINNVLSLFAKTQRYSLLEQLNRGVRCLDLRLKKVNGQLWAFHDFVDLNLNWSRIWRTISGWLETYPKEGLVMMIRDENYKKHHEIAMEAISAADPKKFVLNNDEFTRGSELTIGNLRGKVFVFNHSEQRSIPWADNRNFIVGSTRVTDRYDFSDSIEEKLKILQEFYLHTPTRTNGDKDSAIGAHDHDVYFNVMFTSRANNSPLSSIQNTASVVNSEFLNWLQKTAQQMKGCVIMADWVE